MKKLITKLEITSDKPYKSRDIRGNCFAVDGVFTCEDGEKINTRVTSERKKNIPDAIARKQRSIAAKSIHAENDFIVETFSFGASGLVPSPH